MLEDFLRRVGGHPILSGEHVFHRFLEEGVSWVSIRGHDLLRMRPFSGTEADDTHNSKIL